MTNRSKSKGSGFEITVCRLLTEWITGEPKPEIFWRSASSGAKATQDFKSDVQSKMAGDIVAIDAAGQWFTDMYSVECKFYKDFKFEHVLEGKGHILKWWEQCVGDAKKSDKLPMLIFKKNRSPIYLGITCKGTSKRIPNFDIMILDDFLKEFSPEHVKNHEEM